MAGEVPNGIGLRLANLFGNAADKAVRELAEDVLRKARADAPQAGPDDPDPSVNLRTGGRVDRVREGVYDIVFDEPHAAKQHEAMHFEHPRGGGPKFLERNVQLAARDLENRIEAEVTAVTRRGDSGGTVRVSTRSF